MLPVVVADTAAGPVVEDGPIRRFLNSGIQKTIDDALAALPPEKKVAVVAHTDFKGASLSVAARLPGGWSIVAGAYKPWKGELQGEASVRWSV